MPIDQNNSPTTAPKVTLIVMTLNELEGMKVIMPQIDQSLLHQIIILDGGSTDGTVEWAEENGYQTYIQKRKGIRFAYFECLPLITGDTIITFSPDGNSPPEAIPELINKFNEGYDMVIGSRYLGPAKSADDDIVTAFGNWLFTRTVNLLHGGNYTDVMVIYRIYKKSLIEDLDLLSEDAYALPEKLFSTIISWEPLLSVRAAKAGLAITEIPVDEPERIGGERKLQVLRWGAAYYFQFFREVWFARHLKKKR
ncbi:MAG: glycosyltransferase family 2 protein [Magnetovibrionaceae bacterium]